jgi:sortase A
MRVKKILVWSQHVFFIAGFSALGYCALVVGAARYYQARERDQISTPATGVAVRSEPPGLLRPVDTTLRVGSGLALVGRVEAPRIQLSAMVAEGASSRVLRLAVGHVPGTALPWQSGNVTLVAHRDTFFRRLGELKPGDVIRITVPGNQYTYRVTFSDIVNPEQTWVLQPATGETLTLVTCYPFHFVGSAPQRFVVRARLEAN